MVSFKDCVKLPSDAAELSWGDLCHQGDMHVLENRRNQMFHLKEQLCSVHHGIHWQKCPSLNKLNIMGPAEFFG